MCCGLVCHFQHILELSFHLKIKLARNFLKISLNYIKISDFQKFCCVCVFTKIKTLTPGWTGGQFCTFYKTYFTLHEKKK